MDETVESLKPDEMYCSSCGKAIKKDAEICPHCGVRQKSVTVKQEKSPGIAAIASAIWCGLGQIYNGQIGKGIGLMIAYAFSALLCLVLIGFLTTPVLWIYGIYDAYKTAEKINQG